jgi:hypothetical protein
VDCDDADEGRAAVNRHQQIVLALLQDQLEDPARGQIEALNEGDWREVIGAAETQGVAPLLFRNVQRLGVKPPQTIQDRLKQNLRDNTARNLRFLQEFARLARALQSQAIDFMPLKGVYLCSNVYENLGERGIWDLDLIVPRAEMRRAVQAIEGTGYRSSRPYDLDLELKSYHHVPPYIKSGAPPLELHWTLLNPRFRHGLEWQAVWERSVPARIGEAQVQTLSAGDLVIYLCAHVAYQHVYIDSVRSLYDIKLALRRFSAQLEWDAIARRASECGLLNSAYLSLRLAHELLGSPLPEAAWQALHPAEFNERLTQAALARIFETGASPVINAVWTRPNTRLRVKGLLERLFVPPSVLAGRYGLLPDSRRVYFYYFVRAADLLRVHGRNLLDLMLGGKKKRELALQDSALVDYLKWWQ